ncbi:unnamed protein product [Amoebophrya sp. A120]|nr:unnamed protein product [Amoebophrya sp. A120]|eukprot:GSA120T00022121001.1
MPEHPQHPGSDVAGANADQGLPKRTSNNEGAVLDKPIDVVAAGTTRESATVVPVKNDKTGCTSSAVLVETTTGREVTSTTRRAGGASSSSTSSCAPATSSSTTEASGPLGNDEKTPVSTAIISPTSSSSTCNHSTTRTASVTGSILEQPPPPSGTSSETAAAAAAGAMSNTLSTASTSAARDWPLSKAEKQKMLRQIDDDEKKIIQEECLAASHVIQKLEKVTKRRSMQRDYYRKRLSQYEEDYLATATTVPAGGTTLSSDVVNKKQKRTTSSSGGGAGSSLQQAGAGGGGENDSAPSTHANKATSSSAAAAGSDACSGEDLHTSAAGRVEAASGSVGEEGQEIKTGTDDLHQVAADDHDLQEEEGDEDHTLPPRSAGPHHTKLLREHEHNNSCQSSLSFTVESHVLDTEHDLQSLQESEATFTADEHTSSETDEIYENSMEMQASSQLQHDGGTRRNKDKPERERVLHNCGVPGEAFVTDGHRVKMRQEDSEVVINATAGGERESKGDEKNMAVDMRDPSPQGVTESGPESVSTEFKNQSRSSSSGSSLGRVSGACAPFLVLPEPEEYAPLESNTLPVVHQLHALELPHVATFFPPPSDDEVSSCGAASAANQKCRETQDNAASSLSRETSARSELDLAERKTDPEKNHDVVLGTAAASSASSCANIGSLHHPQCNSPLQLTGAASPSLPSRPSSQSPGKSKRRASCPGKAARAASTERRQKRKMLLPQYFSIREDQDTVLDSTVCSTSYISSEAESNCESGRRRTKKSTPLLDGRGEQPPALQQVDFSADGLRENYENILKQQLDLRSASSKLARIAAAGSSDATSASIPLSYAIDMDVALSGTTTGAEEAGRSSSSGILPSSSLETDPPPARIAAARAFVSIALTSTARCLADVGLFVWLQLTRRHKLVLLLLSWMIVFLCGYAVATYFDHDFAGEVKQAWKAVVRVAEKNWLLWSDFYSESE